MNNETRKDLSPEEVAATEYEPGRRHTANWVEECKEWIKLF